MSKGYAIVTGASNGIGLQIAKELAEKSYSLILVARRMERLENLKTEIVGKCSVNVHCISCDLSEPGAALEIYREIQKKNCNVEILVNNAGIGTFKPFVDTSVERLNEMMRLNVNALTNLTLLFMKDMVRKGSGKIMLVSSIVAFQAVPYYSAYSATKSYVLFLGKALAHELRNTHVTITTLIPGSTRTDFQKISGFQPSAMAERNAADPKFVAKKAVDGLVKGKRVVIPGWSNKILHVITKILPSRVMITLSGKMMNRSIHS